MACLLESKGYPRLLPLYQSWNRSAGRMRGVLLPLFPGYVFCRFDVHRRLPILMTSGVLHIVGKSHEPEAIPDEQIENIRTACSSGLQVNPSPYLERGDRVRIEFGPLQGVEGIFLAERNSARLVISIEILKRSVGVEVDRDWILPLSARRGALQLSAASSNTSASTSGEQSPLA